MGTFGVNTCINSFYLPLVLRKGRAQIIITLTWWHSSCTHLQNTDGESISLFKISFHAYFCSYDILNAFFALFHHKHVEKCIHGKVTSFISNYCCSSLLLYSHVSVLIALYRYLPRYLLEHVQRTQLYGQLLNLSVVKLQIIQYCR